MRVAEGVRGLGGGSWFRLARRGEGEKGVTLMTDLPKRKYRTTSHRMEDQSVDLLRAVLPDEWVVRNYKPDYGIDLVVELFADASDDGKSATLGEHLFVQLKSVQQGDYAIIRAQPRFNVELPDPTPKSAHSSSQTSDEAQESAMPEDFVYINVIKYSVETSLLNTVDAMGAAVPVLLVLVDLPQSRVFYVCLNDYIDKLIWPTKEHFQQQGHVTLYIPCSNELTPNSESLLALRWYGKRAKLYSAFAKIALQTHYLSAIDGQPDHPERVLLDSRHFLQVISRLDFWSAGDLWGALQGKRTDIEEAISSLDRALIDGEERVKVVHRAVWVKTQWEYLAAMSRVHEEVCREWFLPTYLSELLRG